MEVCDLCHHAHDASQTCKQHADECPDYDALFKRKVIMNPLMSFQDVTKAYKLLNMESPSKLVH